MAGTRAGARGKGIGTLLTQYGLAQTRAAGNGYCETDWRSANLLASRFWRDGFVEDDDRTVFALADLGAESRPLSVCCPVS